jgi:PAS domain S-box-containing protein
LKPIEEHEERELRSVALENARTILLARQRAEEQLLAAKEALQEETRLLELLNETGAKINSELNLETLIQMVTDAATELSDAQFGAFFYNVVNEQGEAFLLYTLSGAPKEAFEHFGMPRNTKVFEPTFSGTRVVRSDDITADSRYGKMAPHYGMPEGHLPVRSYLAVPVVSRSGEVYGGLFFGHGKPGVFTERSERLVVGVASQAAIAIENARLYESAQQEIKQRRRVEEELRKSEANLAEFFENAPTGIAWLAQDGQVVRANSAFQSLLGYTKEPLAGKNISQLSADAKQMQTLLEGLAGRDALHEEPAVLQRKDGSFVHVRVTANVYREDGRFVHARAFFRDITAERQAQEALEESESRLRAIFDQAGVGMATAGLDWKFEQVNKRFTEILGYSQEELVQMSFMDFTHPDDADQTRTYVNQLLEGKIPDYVFEKRYIRKDGRIVWSRTSVALMRDASGSPKRFVGVIEDITQRKEAERALLESEQRFRQLADAMPQIVWAAKPDGTLDYYNERWYEYTGFKRGKTGDDSWKPILHPDDVDRCTETWYEAVRSGQPYEIEYRFKDRMAGGYKWFLGKALPVQNEKGEIVRWFGTCTDIDAQKRSEEQKRQILESERAARMESEKLGRLKDEFLATLSHELRTPLNAILGWAHLIRKDPQDVEKALKGLEVIERSARTQAQLIADLLDMSRIITGKLRLDIQPVELPLVVEAALDSIRPAAEAKGVRIVKLIEPVPELIRGDPARLQQVVWNLLSNAVKFTPKDGKVEVVLNRVNSHVQILVRDTGKGIRPDFLPHLFERFRQEDSSASRDHGGLGIGLALVKQLVELHGGTVHATSAGEGKGATFLVELPLVAAKVEGRELEHVLPRPRALAGDSVRGELPNLENVRVLVVDDDADARTLLTRILADHGAEPTAVRSGREALERLQADKFDVLLSDIGMPAMDGYALIEALRNAGNYTPAAALTAFARSEDRTRALLAGYQSHIAKPVEPTELLATIASLAGKTIPKG